MISTTSTTTATVQITIPIHIPPPIHPLEEFIMEPRSLRRDHRTVASPEGEQSQQCGARSRLPFYVVPNGCCYLFDSMYTIIAAPSKATSTETQR